RHPDGGGAEPLDVVEPFGEALEVAALVEALVGGVVAGGQAGTGQTAAVVGGVPVGETVRHDEVELLAGVVVPRGLGRGPRAGRRGGRGGRPGGEGRQERRGERDDGEGRDPSPARETAPPGRRPSRYHRLNSLRLRLDRVRPLRRGTAPSPGARATVSPPKRLQQEL